MALFDVVLKTLLLNMNTQIVQLPKYVLSLTDTFREPLGYRRNLARLNLFYSFAQSCIK